MFVESNPRRKPMSQFDQEYAANNIAKHGSNFKAMERDTIVNFNQFTENQIQKMCTKYLALEDKDRCI
jgi:predicted outer membrane protein